MSAIQQAGGFVAGHDTPGGFRQKLYESALQIIPRVLAGGAIRGDGQALREAWECAKVGNTMLDALHAVEGVAAGEDVQRLVFAPGFLSSLERWHAARLRGRAVRAWRGCSQVESERSDFGFSWTLDRRIAEFFAARASGPAVVVEARVWDGIWLDTKESEFLGLFVEREDILRIDPVGKGPNLECAWSEVTGLRPTKQHIIDARPGRR